jgi:hypothetical protein
MLACLPDLGKASCIENAGYRISQITDRPTTIEYFTTNASNLNPSFNFLVSVHLDGKSIIRRDNQLAALRRWSITEDRLHARFPPVSGSIFIAYVVLVMGGVYIKIRRALKEHA